MDATPSHTVDMQISLATNLMLQRLGCAKTEKVAGDLGNLSASDSLPVPLLGSARSAVTSSAIHRILYQSEVNRQTIGLTERSRLARELGRRKISKE